MSISKEDKAKISKEKIIGAAYTLANEGRALFELTRVGVAMEAGCAPSLINHYFGNGLGQVRSGVVSLAVKNRNWGLIAAALYLGETEAENLPREIKEKALQEGKRGALA